MTDTRACVRCRATALHYAASAGAAKAMAALLDAGAEVGLADGRGATALHRASACAVGSEECVGLLLDRGATPGAQDEAGASPLHVAVLAGLSDTVLLLLRRGASLTVPPPPLPSPSPPLRTFRAAEAKCRWATWWLAVAGCGRGGRRAGGRRGRTGEPA